VLFPPGKFSAGVEPICRSNDAIVPAPGIKTPQAATCAKCPHSQWYDGKRPPCDLKIQMLAIVKNHPELEGLPRYISFGGKSLQSFKLTLDRIHQSIVVAKAKGQNLSLFDFYFTLHAQKQTFTGGVYFVARFKDVKRVLDLNEYGPLFIQYATQKREEEEQQEQQANEQNTNDAVSNVVNAELI
jgi:hypothetical protein